MNGRNITKFIVPALAGYVIVGAFRFSISVLLPELQKSFELTGTQTGIIMSSLLLGTLIILNLASVLSNRVGRRAVIATGLTFNSLGMLLLGIANSYYVFVGATFLAGAGTGLLAPSIYGLIGEITAKSRGFLVGIINALYAAVGGFIGPFLAGVLTGEFGWRISPYIFSASSFLAAIIFWVLSKDSQIEKQGTASNNKLHGKTSNLREVSIACASMFAAYFGFITASTWTPSFMSNTRGFDEVQTGTIFGTMSLMGGVGAIVLGWLSDKCDRRIVILGSALATATTALFFYSYALTFINTLMVSVLIGFTASAFWNLTISVAQDLVDPPTIVAATGLIQTVGLLGGIAGPVVSAELINEFGPTMALITCVSISYLIQGTLILFARNTKPLGKDNI